MKSAIFFFTIAFSAAAGAASINHCGSFKASVHQGTPAQKLKRFLDVQWKYQMTEFPEAATANGYPGQNDRWTDQSLAAIERRRAETRCQLESLKTIQRTALNATDRVSLDIARRDLEISIEGDRFGGDYMPLNHLNGLHIDSVDTLLEMPTANTADFRDIITRLERLPAAFAQVEILMREGLKRHLTPTKMFLPKVTAQLDDLMPAKVEDSPYYTPFKDMSVTISAQDKDTLRQRARAAIQEKIYPALAHFKQFMTGEYIPQARESIAWTDMPQGKDWYAYLVRTHTTTAKAPEELHELGLREVARITAEMQKIKDQVKFKGDLQAFNKFLLTDPRFYFTKPEDLLSAYRDIAKRIDPELTRMFKTVPRMTYGVREVPAFRAASSPGAEYQPGSADAGRAGWFQANSSDLKSQPKWEMETLTFHEAVPGHHLQGAVADELEGLPEFRKHDGNTAYIEGWALYAETLGEEMGFYKDPYSLYGHYSDEMLRAVRLVVDTGMHTKGWTRDKALAYYRAQMPTSDVASAIEIDRYIVWPGQALAYKVGQLKIRELRDRAAQELGAAFDVRAFHDVVLGQGALPMDILENVVNEWVDAGKRPEVRRPAALGKTL
jgi:uncharacterized protein (DUF885 family)